MSIRILNNNIANKIAAGEVITDPNAVIKELVENSIDAKSRNINIHIENGGKKKITVSDDGEGILSNEVCLAFKRHATSKIYTLEDLDRLDSLGFRGEALPSIAAISKVSIKTHSIHEEIGCYAVIKENNIDSIRKSFSKGTSISIEDLFYNTPARLKHMKKASEESKHIILLVERLALSHPDISFSLNVEDRNVIKTPGDGNMLNCIHSIFDYQLGDNLISIQYENKPLIISGYLGNQNNTNSTRRHQYIYINNRYIQDVKINKAIEEAYENTIMINQHPKFILNIDLPPHMLDVNIHPSKTKIKILNESLVLLLIKDGIKKTLREFSTVKSYKDIELKKNKIISEDFKQESIIKYKNDFINESPISYIKNKEVMQKKTAQESNDGKDEKVETAETVEIVEKVGVENKSKESMNKLLSNQKSLFSMLINSKLIGQLFNTYILFEIEDSILLLDQHASHERILYEDISKKIKDGNNITQNIFPANLKLSPSDYQLVLNQRKFLSNLGFEFDEFGQNTICLRSVPIFFNKPQDSKLLIEIIEEINNKNSITNISKFQNDIIKSACKKAIKANNKLSDVEIKELINLLIACEYPYTCPHGRPTIFKLTKYELEKLFKRVL
ncbi:MAG: DNA mismatch repair endonuclease MutL [Eubacteriaceae bacterium]